MASDLPDVVEKYDEPSIANGDHTAVHPAQTSNFNSKETEDVLHSDVKTRICFRQGRVLTLE